MSQSKTWSHCLSLTTVIAPFFDNGRNIDISRVNERLSGKDSFNTSDLINPINIYGSERQKCTIWMNVKDNTHKVVDKNARVHFYLKQSTSKCAKRTFD